jgi:hypothetical protein
MELPSLSGREGSSPISGSEAGGAEKPAGLGPSQDRASGRRAGGAGGPILRAAIE